MSQTFEVLVGWKLHYVQLHKRLPLSRVDYEKGLR